MSHKTLTIIVVGLCVFFAGFSLAQDQPAPRVFKLLHEDQVAKKNLAKEQAQAKHWTPQLEKGQLNVSLSLGNLGLKTAILSQEQVIYKYNTEATYWGDLTINGAAAFNPLFRLGYSLQRWFAVEGVVGLSFSDFSSTITNRHRRKNEAGAAVDFEEPPLGEFDAEARSLLTRQIGANAVLYPLDIHGEGGGRWHPYLTAGIGRMWYDMNSNYNDGDTGSSDFNFGGGIRLLADKVISIRLEAVMHHNTLQWTPVKNFLSLSEGTLLVPLEEFPTNDDGSFDEQRITSYAATDMNVLSFSLGFQATF